MAEKRKHVECNPPYTETEQIQQWSLQNDAEILANYSGVLNEDGSVVEQHNPKKQRMNDGDAKPAVVQLGPTEDASAEKHPYAHLPITEVPGLHPNCLAEKNRFSGFDDHVHFDEPTHVYTVDGIKYRGSCTGFLGQWFGKFDPEAVADKIVGSWKWKNSKSYRYYQMTKEEVMADWTMANKLGTRMHYCAELFMNGIEVPNHPDFQTVEYAHHFKNFWRDHVEGKLRPWRSEWIVFHRVYEIIGSVDGIFQRVDSDDPYELVLYDWKRCIKIEQEAYQNEKATGPFAALPKANFWKYSLQLNTYKFIIEEGTPYRVSDMFLLRCHPNSANYERIKVPDMQDYVRNAVAVRFERLMETDLTTLARALKKLSNLPEGSTSAIAPTGARKEETDSGAHSAISNICPIGNSEEENEEQCSNIPESPLDPAALALQVLSRYKAHRRTVGDTDRIASLSSRSESQSTVTSASAEDVRLTYKFDDA